MAKNKKKKPAAKKPQTREKSRGKKPFPKKPVIITVCIVVAAAAAGLVFGIRACSDAAKDVLKNTSWYSASATDASGDEVALQEIYNVKYSNYRGGLSFTDDGRFELWLTPGDPAEGTHSGTYAVEDDSVTAVFDEGTQTEFPVKRENGRITQITVGYDGYEVVFLQSE